MSKIFEILIIIFILAIGFSLLEDHPRLSVVKATPTEIGIVMTMLQDDLYLGPTIHKLRTDDGVLSHDDFVKITATYNTLKDVPAYIKFNAFIQSQRNPDTKI